MTHPIPQFEELAFHETPLGELSLRRRTILALENREIHEIILGDAYLMSSLFTEVEKELSNLGLDLATKSFPEEEKLDVVVGGLGLGYTAREALLHDEVGSLIVVDYLQPVIDWHREGLVPLGPGLCADDRCRFVLGDFFKLALGSKEEATFDPDTVGRKFHAVLLDIDHSPANLLHERHGEFYSAEGLRILAEKLHSGGVFGLWSDDPPEESFLNALEEVFESCGSHVVSFYNPLQDKDSKSTVYLAKKQ